jgi:hypothetical protein
LLLSLSAGLWLGCGGSDVTAPALGTLDITTATSGPEPDPDGYRVTVDGGAAEPIGPSATLHHANVLPGSHTVELSGAAQNCTVADQGLITVSVPANGIGTAAFSITCRPTTGSIEVTTVTGAPADPDGYLLMLDGSGLQPIGTSATVTLTTIAPGLHTVGLGGVAQDCTVQGDNPRPVGVTAGDTADVAMTVSCAEPPPPPGTLHVTTTTTGAEPDPDGYTLALDGGTAQPIGTEADLSIPNLSPGAHPVVLGGIAGNCAVTGDNPRMVTIVSGATAETSFAVTCAATTGTLAVTVSGLPDGVDAAVTVSGPESFSQALTATRTLTDLSPGSYTVDAASVTGGEDSYDPSPASQPVEVAAGAQARATVTYARVAAPTVDLRIAGIELTQSTQDTDGSVPMVRGRNGFLRVFAVANEANSATPRVRVRLFSHGAPAATLSIAAPGSSTPTSRNDGSLTSSWNAPIPGALVQPGLSVLADVDPDNTMAERDESNNSFPSSGGAQSVDVESPGAFAVTLVPVKQSSNGLQGDVTEGTKDRYLDLLTRIYPLPGTDAEVHEVYLTDTSDPLQPGDGNDAWGQVLSEINVLRVAEGSARTYYGVVKPGYSLGVVGLGFIGAPAAIGWDDLRDASRVMAHEMGHTWGRFHAPCGNATNPDRSYPYARGSIGVYGLDVTTGILKPPSTPDIMGYCLDPWISDYTYRGVLAFRSTHPAAAASSQAQRCLLVWGRIVGGRPVLEPAFEVVTRPRLPRGPGPYSISAVSDDGGRLFELAFDAEVVADDPHDGRMFAFAVPLDPSAAARLAMLRLAGPAGEAVIAPAAAALAGPAPADSVRVERSAEGLALHWDPTVHPMIMIRDPETGQVLSFARGGEASVVTGKPAVELVVSDGLRSTAKRVSLFGRLSSPT